FHGVQVKAGTPLHWRVIKECLKFLGDYLLDEHKAPELELEPIEVLLRTFFRPIIGPALTLERIEPKVDQVGNVGMSLFTQPAAGLIDESKFIIVKAHCPNGAFAKVEDLVALGWTFAGNGIGLVVAIKMVLVSPMAEFHTFE